MYRGTKQDPVPTEASRTSARRPRKTAAVVCAAAMTLVFAGSSAASAAFAEPSPPATDLQHTIAIMKPSIVKIYTTWTGHITKASYNGVNVAQELGLLLAGNPNSLPAIEYKGSCSGYVASPEGWIVTAGHCVQDTQDPFGGKGKIIKVAIADLATAHGLPASTVASMTDYAYGHWTVEGSAAGSPPERVVDVFPTVESAKGVPASTPLVANVKDADIVPFNKGDVALLKVEPETPLPALGVAATAPNVGTRVVAAGFPGTVTGTVDKNAEPTINSGDVSGKQTVDGVPFPSISAATSQGMSGGPVVDAQGNVVGVVSWSPSTETQSINFMTDTSTVKDLLSAARVSPELSQTDKTYRDGLDNFYAGKYNASVTDFDQVLAKQPKHAQAAAYKTLASDCAGSNPPTQCPSPSTEGSGSSTLMWILIGVGVFVLAALAAGTTFLLRRRRRGGAAQAQSPVADVSGPRQPAQSPTEQVADGRTTPSRDGQFCTNCGEPHDAGTRFCASCGTRFPTSTTQRGEGSSE